MNAIFITAPCGPIKELKFYVTSQSAGANKNWYVSNVFVATFRRTAHTRIIRISRVN